MPHSVLIYPRVLNFQWNSLWTRFLEPVRDSPSDVCIRSGVSKEVRIPEINSSAFSSSVTVRVTFVLDPEFLRKSEYRKLIQESAWSGFALKLPSIALLTLSMLLFPIAGPKQIITFGQEESYFLSISFRCFKILDCAIRSCHWLHHPARYQSRRSWKYYRLFPGFPVTVFWQNSKIYFSSILQQKPPYYILQDMWKTCYLL